MDATKGATLHKLTLPSRYEKLEQAAQAASVPIQNIVQKVESATRHTEELLRKVRDHGVGRFEFLLGLSGSGKTTFLRTLPLFYNGASVHEIPASYRLDGIVPELRRRRAGVSEPSIFVLFDRDNPVETEQELKSFFEQLRVFFREPGGGVVLFWPITDTAAAHKFAELAWQVGRESVVDLETRGVYLFKGIEKADYYFTAEQTTQTLNGGRSLEAFGITPSEATPIGQAADTIAEFFGRIQARSVEINNSYGDLLKERVVPRVWILLAGDDAREVYTTVSTLTHGIWNEVDVRRLLGYLNDPSLDAAYLKEWKKRREKMVYLMTLLDVRVFVLPPNVCVNAVRAFGSEGTRANLTTQAISAETAMSALRSAAFYKAILDPRAPTTGIPADTKDATADEYNRLQVLASKDDKSLNKALGLLVEKTLIDDGVSCVVVSEKQNLPDSNLKPDIQVEKQGERVICLEPTWRTTGKPIPVVRATQSQNTLTTGHIQQYVLQKILSYVADLGI